MSESRGSRPDHERCVRIFAEYLTTLPAAGVPDPDGLAKDHPEIADELRAMCEEWRCARDALDEEVAETVVVTGDGVVDSRWRAFIQQLKSRGPMYTRYLTKGEIARGGMGAIHRVYDQDGRRTLAMKVALGQGDSAADDPTPPVDDRTLGRFLEEAQVTGQLDHPGIVPVHDIGVDADDRVYFTMKLVKGEDLRSVFARVHDSSDDSWNMSRALNVLLRVCEAMAYSHDKGVIHRDLKPGNVMVGRFGEVYVMDWGLARVLGREDTRDLRLRAPDTTSESLMRSDRRDVADTPDEALLTMDGDVVGTPAYMPPEQASGRVLEIGPAADVYSVGAMLYHLLAGHMPYVRQGDRKSSRMILAEVCAGPPPAISDAEGGAPLELIAICERSMQRDIQDRYPDMAGLAFDLRAFLERRVVSAYESGGWAELKKWVQRNRALSISVAVAMVAVIALSAWALVERGAAVATAHDLLRLSDARLLSQRKAEMDELWPAYPDRVEDMEHWLGRARKLIANLPAHEETLATVRAGGSPVPLDRPLADRVPADHELGRDYEFGEDTNAKWWHDTLRDLVVGIHALQAEDRYGETLASMEWRLEFANSILERTVTGGEASEAWALARAAIRAHPRYDGLDLPPQIGLIPLGADPESTLWEFVHVQTGSLPERDASTGSLRTTGETGVVLVLIPGGTYSLGAQATDEAGPNYDFLAVTDETPHSLTLDPYFLSKYELTQGQWRRLTGSSPSFWLDKDRFPGATSDAHPIDTVSWEQCDQVLRRAGLELPTEAQWEVGCRGGETTPWSFGSDPSAFVDFANLRDKTFSRQLTGEELEPVLLDDGWSAPAPVGSLRPNGLGIHDAHGNLWEWCRDFYGPYSAVARSGDGLREPPLGSGCVNRGGSFSDLPAEARSANRSGDSATLTASGIGCRAARAIDEGPGG